MILFASQISLLVMGGSETRKRRRVIFNRGLDAVLLLVDVSLGEAREREGRERQTEKGGRRFKKM